MRGKTATAIVLVIVIVAAGALVMWFQRHGFSAREEPAWYEKTLARHARKIATPAGAKELKNPHPLTEESLPAAREHWVAHCSSCHALDGSGNTTIGRNLYPKAPDMRDMETQKLSDGELFYIISNGVRFTGMPAWGEEDSPQSIWELVGYIRRLSHLSAEEKQLLEKLSSGESGEGKPTASPPPKHTHSHASGAPPHKH
ncbi:MAG: c-type cytochrome [Acidobacteria bacterium]|nr:c-type cytochrome [Acidobacteriota bacterium]MBI3663047.1 c-type cytochrome [Acidobacteriota bacterium]